ncbi:MAG: hypothetical protein ACRDNF_07580 [Streptosporangiaceae bacterium]
MDLIVPNLADFNLRNITALLEPASMQSFGAFGMTFADQAVFWSCRPRVLVLYPGVDQEWLSDVHTALGSAVPPIVAPCTRTGALIPDLLADAGALAELRSSLGSPRQVHILFWGATREAYELIAVVSSWGHEVVADVPPEASFWTSSYLDSKLSVADLAAGIQGIQLPRTWTVANWTELRGALRLLVSKEGDAVVKSAYGVGGKGCAIVTADPRSEEQFWSDVGSGPFFRDFPMLVQQYVRHEPGAARSAVDILIGAHGIEQAITSTDSGDGWQLLAIGWDSPLLPSSLSGRLRNASATIAEAAAQMGFRGWIGADFIAGQDGQIYLIELNARRTGGMHGVGLLSRSTGLSRPGVACSADALALTTAQRPTYAIIRSAFHHMWARGLAVYPSTVRGLTRDQPLMGVVAIASNAARAHELVGEALSLTS